LSLAALLAVEAGLLLLLTKSEGREMPGGGALLDTVTRPLRLAAFRLDGEEGEKGRVIEVAVGVRTTPSVDKPMAAEVAPIPPICDEEPEAGA
jgi:hypothetical protein